MLKNRIQKTYFIGIYLAVFFVLFLYFGTAHANHAAAAPASVKKETLASPYVTTAYYLNIRADSSSRSKILKVVKKGTMLQVVGKSERGWLKLNGGGFVHGAYAKLTGKQERQAEPPAPTLSVDNKLRKPVSQVRSKSGLTEKAIQSIFKGTALAGHGLEKAVLDVEAEQGINAYFTIAVMRLESGNGSSKVAKIRNNLFGLNSSNGTGYLRFKTKVDSVLRFGQLISQNYIGKGYITVDKIARKYCPANPKWPAMVKTIINRDYRG
jgi:flagellum-specific peptidoglycan hydrolase FlgJ